MFIAYLIDNGRKSTTIKSYISAIRAVISNEKVKLDDQSILLGALTRACRLHVDKIQHRIPMRKGLLSLLIRSLDSFYKDNPQPYLVILFKAIFVASYYGMLCIGEVSYSKHIILAENTHIGVNKEKIMFILRSSKTHGENDKPQIIKIDSIARNLLKDLDRNVLINICPFEILRNYITNRKKQRLPQEQLFVFRD